MAHDKLKYALAENTAQLKVLADRYVSVLAGAQKQIEEEEAKDFPSQWKIEALENIVERAENNVAKFKAGSGVLPEWMQK